MTKKRTRAGARKTEATSASTSAHIARPAIVEQLVKAFLFLWGSNAFGQLGMGEDIMERVRPTPADFGEEVLDVATGGMHTVVLLGDGTLWSAGVNDDGALGRETADDESGVPIPGRNATEFGEVRLPPDAKPARQVVCTDSASFVRAEDGSVYGWGTFRNEHGVFGFSDKVRRQFNPIGVYKAGGRSQPIVQLAAGSNHVVGILKDGGAVSWGDGDQGQLGRISLRNSGRSYVKRRSMLTPTKVGGCRTMKFVDVFCGEYSSFLRADNGHFFAFGLNNSCQLAIPHLRSLTNEENLLPESRSANLVTLLKPTFVETLSNLNILKVAPGKDHGIAVNEAGCLYSWGAPTYGVLGRNEMMDRAQETTPFPQPKLVNGVEDKTIVDIASGQVMSGCIDSEGDLYTWGASLNEMLGYPADDDVLLPKKVPRRAPTETKKFLKIKFGGQHCAMLAQ